MKTKNLLIIILTILVVGLVGYIVYDKVFDSTNSNVGNTNDNSIYETTQLDSYKNYSGNYGIVDTLTYEDIDNPNVYYYINLDLAGNVYYGYVDGNDSQENFLLENVVDIVNFSDGAGSIDVENCFMLDSNGDVYRYKISELIDGKMSGQKMNVSNVEKIVNVSWNERENAGGNWALVAITSTSEFVELIRAGV